MFNLKRTAPTILFFCLSFSSVKAQLIPPQSSSEEQRRRAEAKQRRDDEFNQRNRDLQALTRDEAGNIFGRPTPRAATLSKEERARIKAALAPNEADAAKYKAFLKQKDTGLFRLFPDFDCQEKNIVRVSGNCADLVPGSWSYSFRRKDYSNENLFDISLKDGNLISEGFLSQGVLVRLGDLPLEAVTPASAGLKFLSDFVPQVESQEAKKQFAKLAKGVAEDGFQYATSAPAEENTTYALRVVAYRVKGLLINPANNLTADDIKFGGLNSYDNRTDLTVAFRIVRRDENGSVTILWKQLKRQDSPKLVFAKNEKLSDIKSK